MIKSIFENLYYGRYSAWERRPALNEEHRALNRKIGEEKQYFRQKLSPEDSDRLQALEDLSQRANTLEEIEGFSYGFKLGVMLMCAVFADDNDPKAEAE